MIDYAAARQHMVDCQVRTNRVTDVALIETLREVPRERFVPQRLKGIAYVDEDLEIAPGRYLMEPMVFARLVQATRVTPTDVVLDLASGTGYGAAVLSRLASTVVAVESDTALAEEATAALAEVGADNVVMVGGDPFAGNSEQAPFDVIVWETGLETMPETVLSQLAEGGRAVAVVRRPGEVGQAILWERHRGHVSHRTMFDAQVPLLPGPVREPSFVF